MEMQSQESDSEEVEGQLVFEEVSRRTGSSPFDQSLALDSQHPRDEVEAANASELDRIIEY